MSDHKLVSTLKSNIDALKLPELASRALFLLAQDPHGIEREAGPSMLASILEISGREADQALILLLGKNLLIEDGQNGDERYFANYDALRIDAESRDFLIQRKTPYDGQGSPHSIKAMNGLEHFFGQDDHILIGLEVTSPTAFKSLTSRLLAHRKTTFLIPRKCDVNQSRKRHYDEVLSEWIQFINDGPKAHKDCMEIRVTNRPFPDLYTSAISSDKVRFDIYFLDTETTRSGEILEVKNNTSLYHAINKRYEEALRNSWPLFKIWPTRAASYWMRKIIFPSLLVIVGVILAILANPYAAIGSALAIGILANVISTHIGVPTWYNPELFKK